MPQKNINYYGYTKDAYYDCIDLIGSTNRKHIFILNTWFLLVNFLYLIFSILNLFGVNQERIPFYAIYVAISVVFDIIIIALVKKGIKNNVLLIYASMIIMLCYGILISIAQPYMPATMFLILLVITTISYIDKMNRMALIVIVIGATFLATSFMYKTFSIAYHDAYNLAIVLLLSLGLHYTFQRTRLQQFVLYQKEQQIQRELEVKSSFDALTSLLNRARFFSVAEELLRQAKDEYLILCLLDLDGFKQINDSLGHQMGDKAIQVAGGTIIKSLNIDISEKWSFTTRILKEKGSFAGRLGGDEFIAIIRGCTSKEEALSIMKGMLKDLNESLFDGVHGLQASFGATEISNSKDRASINIDKAYKRADDALYKSKRSGKNQVHFSASGSLTTEGEEKSV